MSVIETYGLTKRFRRQLAVDSVSFTVEPGQIFGFLGPNGSGKTTTIGMLLGIVTPTAGSFRLLGLEGRRGLHQARQQVGATLETPNFHPYLSGRENLTIVANIKRVPHDRIDAALDTVGLLDRARDRFSAYSLGMKQRLALAATMLGDPKLIILDEPANGLDPEGIREIREIILRLHDMGRTIFLSSHLLWEVERTCTHVAILRKGRIIRQASVREILSGTVTAGIRGGNLETLRRLVMEYPRTVSTSIQEDMVVVELRDDDLAALNAFIAGRGIHLSHLALRQRSLEEVFIELTGAQLPEEVAGNR